MSETTKIARPALVQTAALHLAYQLPHMPTTPESARTVLGIGWIADLAARAGYGDGECTTVQERRLLGDIAKKAEFHRAIAEAAANRAARIERGIPY